MKSKSWRSAHLLGSLSSKIYHKIKVITSVLLGIFAFLSLMAILTATAGHLLNETAILSSSSLAVILYSCFAVLCCSFLFNIALILMSGAFILKGIHKNSTYFMSFSSWFSFRTSNPFLVTFALMFGLILCVCCQLVSTALVSVAGSNRASSLKILWHFLSSAAVLIFATLSLLLFHPMFVQTERTLSEVHPLETACSKEVNEDEIITKKENVESSSLARSCCSPQSPSPLLGSSTQV